MDCSKCHAKCCKDENEAIDLFFFEFMYMIQLKSFQYELRPFLIRMKLPCPFLNEKDQCSIYETRPIMCRIFPFKQLEIGSMVHLPMHPTCSHFKAIMDAVESKQQNPMDSLKQIGSSMKEFEEFYNYVLRNESYGITLCRIITPEEQIAFFNTIKFIMEDDKIQIAKMPTFFAIPTQQFFEQIDLWNKMNEPSYIAFMKEQLEIYRRSKYYRLTF